MVKKGIIAVIIVLLSLIPIFFVMHIGYGFFIILALSFCSSIIAYVKKYKRAYLIVVLSSVFFIVIVLKIAFTTVNYFNGHAKLTFCQTPYGSYHPKYRIPTRNCDCEFGVSEKIMFEIDNYVIYALFEVFGYSKDAYLAYLPSKASIDDSYFVEAYDIVFFNHSDESILLGNNTKTPMSSIDMKYMICSGRSPEAKYRYKYITYNLHAIAVFSNKEDLEYLYRIDNNKIIERYDYVLNW